MSSFRPLEYFRHRLDNNVKILGLIVLTVSLTIAAVVASSNFVQQRQRNELNEAAVQYTKELSKHIKATEEKILSIASHEDKSAVKTFQKNAFALMKNQKGAFRMELRSSSGGLLVYKEDQALDERLISGNRKELPAAVYLNFIRAQEQQRIFWAHSFTPFGQMTLELVAPFRLLPETLWVTRFDPLGWLPPASGIAMPQDIEVSFADPLSARTPSASVVTTLDLLGTDVQLVFSHKNTNALGIDVISLMLAGSGILLLVMLVSYAFESRRNRIAQETIAKQEAALAKQGQLSILGELSTTLAHELNQPLATIANFVAACEMRVKSQGIDDPILLDSLANARQQAMRAGEVVQSIRNYLRKRPNVAATVDISESIELLRPILELSAKEGSSQLRLSHEGEVITRIDPALLEQVIMNLARNAFDAMKDKPVDQRVLMIHSYIHTSQNGSQWCRVDLVDRGHGISQESSEQLFESFFTTKKEGMGIGLSLCRSVAETYGGRVRWKNNPEGGATFSLILPKHKL
jgi:signal transduction histidine kinase